MFLDVDIASGKTHYVNVNLIHVFFLSIAAVNVFKEQLNLIVDVPNVN